MGWKKDEIQKSLDFGRNAVDQSRKSFDKPNEEWINANVTLAKTLFMKKKEYVEAKSLLDEADKMTVEFYGKIHPKALMAKHQKAIMFAEQGKFKEADRRVQQGPRRPCGTR